MWLLLFLGTTGVSGTLYGPHPQYKSEVFTGDAGPRLLLTPYTQSGDIKTGRDLALVTGLNPNITSYSGFFTVDASCDSNLFFWFFPSRGDWLSDPVSVWLNGGPGSSSLFGLLTENGPYSLSLAGELGVRDFAWNQNSSVIYIDQPVGTGFSYTGKGCYLDTETQVGEALTSGLEQFFQLFPELLPLPFYLTGESYAGKYIPATAYAIHSSQPRSKINLQGFAIGDGLVDPVNQQQHGDFLYQLGLVDGNTRTLILDKQEEIRDLVGRGRFEEASNVRQTIYQQIEGFSTYYNYLYENGEPEPNISGFLTLPETREALHVGNTTFDGGYEVSNHLYPDIMQSVKPWLEELLDHYRVLLYFGQLDLRDGFTGAQGYIEKLEWSAAAEYHEAPRKQWRVGQRLAGYSKSASNFTLLLVRNAGHMVPTDQPEWALDMYNRFISNQGF